MGVSQCAKRGTASSPRRILQEDLLRSEVVTEIAFQELFQPSALLDAFSSNFADSRIRGVDRAAGPQFAPRAVTELVVASRKCLAGTYRFSPYLEVLKAKGRDKKPRIVGIPSIRDRVVLHQLNAYLGTVYPDSVPRNIASSFVRTLANDLQAQDVEETWVCGVDVKAFYDSIPHARLMKRLNNAKTSVRAQQLVHHAVLTPTIPRNCKRGHQAQYRPRLGVPQGLSISNILAATYLRDVDEAMASFDVKYFRYVDDVLMYGSRANVGMALKSLRARLRARGLSLHGEGTGKWHFNNLAEPFAYLGYQFSMPVVTVRESSVERFLHSIAAMIADHRHGMTRRMTLQPFLTQELQRSILVAELNERIAGAISGSRRYGWIAFFNQISDLSVLHAMDHAIAKMLLRLGEFGSALSLNVKKLRRAYFEMKYSPKGGYAQNYDEIDTLPKRIEFLRSRGQFAPDETLTEEQVNDRFERYRRHSLAQMQEDEGLLY